MTRVDWRPGALDELAASPEVEQALAQAGELVKQRARMIVRTAYPWSQRYGAINTEDGQDRESTFVDVGYTRSHYGFVLWWSEVGTTNTPARPHLRAALQQVRL